MKQGNNKVIAKYKLLGVRKLGTSFNDYNQPILNNYITRQEYLSINIATELYYELRRKIFMQFSCNWFIL